MPSLPKSYVPRGAAASYRTMTGRDTLILRFRLPGETTFRTKSSPYASNEKRLFFQWARVFLANGGRVPGDWQDTIDVDAQVVAKINADITIVDAVQGYLDDCRTGNMWMAPLEESSLRNQTRPVLGRFEKRFGSNTRLGSVTSESIHEFVVSLGGRKATKKRHLGPVSSLFTWAIRQGHLSGKNPAHGLVFWREAGEKGPSKVVRYYSEEEFDRLIGAAEGDAMALDAIYLARFLACRRHDLVMLRWEDWKWSSLLVEVRRMKTRKRGLETSLVDLHPELAERYRDRQGDRGYCIEYIRRSRSRVEWPADEELADLVQRLSKSEVARKLGCSEAAVRKRLKRGDVGDGNSERQRQLLATAITKRVRRITEAAGLYEKGVQPLHVLRHTFASDALGRGIPPAAVSQWMGISIETLMGRYFHLVPRGEVGNRRANLWGLTAQNVSRIRYA